MRFLFLLAICGVLVSCLHKTETATSKDVDLQSIYYDYKIWGDEDNNDVTVLLQYRHGEQTGASLVPDEPTTVSVDGALLKMDSTKGSGAFYELVKPSQTFKGKHVVVFTDRAKKEHRDSFAYTPFNLSAELPEKLKREPFTIKLIGLDNASTLVRLVMTDTAFNTQDVNEEVIVTDGEITIGNYELNNLESGPVSLEIYTEDDRLVKNGSEKGGRIQVTYGLKRQFQLVD